MAMIEGWPSFSGEYQVGDPESQVVLVTLASELDRSKFLDKVALMGTMKTENIGIEKVVANTISNTSIRYVVVCGAEVHGHLAGDAILALHKNGIDDAGRIIGAKGAIPYLTNLDNDAIERWHDQVDVVDLVNIEDPARILEVIDSLEPREPYPEEPIKAMLGKAETESVKEARILSPELVAIEARVRSIESEVKDLGKIQKVMAGLTSGLAQGFVAGFVLTLLIMALRRFV